IIQNSYARFERSERGGFCGVRATVVSDEVYVNWTDKVIWADKRKQRFPAQIADVEKPKSSKTQDKSRRPRILINLLRRDLGCAARPVAQTRAIYRCGQRLACGTDDERGETFQRKAIAGFRLQMMCCGADRSIRVER